MKRRKPKDIWEKELASQQAEERAYGVEDTEELEFAERQWRGRPVRKSNGDSKRQAQPRQTGSKQRGA